MRYLLDDSSKGNIYAALALIPLGLFFDFMDGKVARWRKKSSMMGQEIDIGENRDAGDRLLEHLRAPSRFGAGVKPFAAMEAEFLKNFDQSLEAMAR